jgi:hypothetical protein
MSSPLRTHAHTGALSVLTVTALDAALTAVPAHAAPVDTRPPRPVPVPGAERAHGDDADRCRSHHAGPTTASITPDSPHYGRPVEYVDAGAHTWVVPKLAPATRARLDPSVFDVGALSGRVPLTVTFAAGARARDLPGLDVRTSSARRAVSGRTTATASCPVGRCRPLGPRRSPASPRSRGATNGPPSSAPPTSCT